MGIFNRKIVSVEIVDHSTTTKKSATSSLTRGIVGGALFGGAGMIAGGLSGKNVETNKTSFLIKYDDGMSEIQTVKNNGMQFNMYMQLVNATLNKSDDNLTIEEDLKNKKQN